LQYEKKKYMREENDVDGYGNDMVLYDNQTLDLTDRALSLLFFSKTNKGFNFGLTIPTTLGNHLFFTFCNLFRIIRLWRSAGAEFKENKKPPMSLFIKIPLKQLYW
ncbi:hypothetical protein Tco_1119018, partial [Tanacetum coccineum]